MIKRIFFILLIFIFTTGFFKSKLEKCADYKFDKISNNQIFPIAEYKYVKRSKEEIAEIIKSREEATEKAIKEYYLLPICDEKKKPKLGLGDFDPNDPNAFGTKRTCRPKYKGGLTFEEIQKNKDLFFAQDDEFKEIKIRDIPKKETDILKKKFLNKNLKKKLNLADTKNSETKASAFYNDKYKICTIEKKNNPEIFKAKY